MKNNHLVIMAGGAGSRFWPLSSEERPKQFLDVLGCGRTLLQLTASRFEGLVPPENVWVVTSAAYHDLVREQLPDLAEDHILLEPCRRNTAPCIAYVSWKIKKLNPRANVVVAPSDHVVTDLDLFHAAVEECMAFSAETDAIVTLGIRPDRPETGYGYIEADLSHSSLRMKNIFRVDSIREKPSLDVAEGYIKEPNYFWNSGIFFWSVTTIVNAFRVYCPEMARFFESLLPVYGTPDEQAAIDDGFPACENISVDYAIMEKAEEIFVYPAKFGWSDLGSWSSLRAQSKQDLHGNACIGEHIDLYETNNCIVHATQEKRVVIQGLDGYVVVEKDDVLLICKLSEEQRIRLFH